MGNERHSTTAEKIAAAAAVATAAAAVKNAEETARVRKEMEAIKEANWIAAQKQERIQLAMAASQAETNFQNTVLATLPLLKHDEERIQFLTEQFVPKLTNTEDDLVIFPVQWVILSEKKNGDIASFLESDAGKPLIAFFSDVNDLAERKADLNERLTVYDETKEKLERTKNPMNPVTLLKVILWGGAFVGLFSIFTSFSWIMLPIAFGAGLFVQLSLNGLQKQKLEAELNKMDSATMGKKACSLVKEEDLHDAKWKVVKSQIAKYLVEEYKPILAGDAHTIILESIALRINEGVQHFQSFLPPSVRLPASHYARFLFTEEDVQQYQFEQNNILGLLEKELEPDYENKTAIWAEDLKESEDSEEENWEGEDLDESEGSEEEEDK